MENENDKTYKENKEKNLHLRILICHQCTHWCNIDDLDSL